MIRTIIFAIASVFFIYISRKSLLSPHSHGFYRFFAWEAITTLILLNIPFWIKAPLSPHQLISWLLLLISIFLLIHGAHMLRVIGKPDHNRSGRELYKFEKTSSLVTVGAYKYIRHPLYSSLLFLAWGAFFKDLSWPGLLLVVLSTFFVFFTAKNDEALSLKHFGEEYRAYMKGTKRFVPFLF